MFSCMKKLILFIVTIFSFSVLADAHTESAKKLFDVLKIEESFDVTAENLRPAMLRQYGQFIDAENGDEASLAVRYSYMHKKLLTDIYHSKRIKDEIIELYKGVFTKDELDTIVAFYLTPAGQKVVYEIPRLQQKMQPVLMSEMQRAKPLADSLMVEFKKELQRMRDSNR